MRTGQLAMILAGACLSAPPAAFGQDGGRRELHEGSAVIRSAENEYLIRILCDDPMRPELGFTTEANRVTRAETGGRYNMARMRLRPWKDTDDVLISIDGGGQAWIPRPSSSGGLLAMDVVLRPGVLERDGQHVLLTYDMWNAGDIPEGEMPFHFEANCANRDPAAPAFKKLK